MNDFPELNIYEEMCKPTHTFLITIDGQESRQIDVQAENNYLAFIKMLLVMFGDNRNAELPPMIISNKRMK